MEEVVVELTATELLQAVLEILGGISEKMEEAEAEETYTFMEKPLAEYSVTEGLLLVIVVLMVLRFVHNRIKEGFSWLM